MLRGLGCIHQVWFQHDVQKLLINFQTFNFQFFVQRIKKFEFVLIGFRFTSSDHFASYSKTEAIEYNKLKFTFCLIQGHKERISPVPHCLHPWLLYIQRSICFMTSKKHLRHDVEDTSVPLPSSLTPLPQ